MLSYTVQKDSGKDVVNQFLSGMRHAFHEVTWRQCECAFDLHNDLQWSADV